MSDNERHIFVAETEEDIKFLIRKFDVPLQRYLTGEYKLPTLVYQYRSSKNWSFQGMTNKNGDLVWFSNGEYMSLLKEAMPVSHFRNKTKKDENTRVYYKTVFAKNYGHGYFVEGKFDTIEEAQGHIDEIRDMAKTSTTVSENYWDEIASHMEIFKVTEFIERS